MSLKIVKTSSDLLAFIPWKEIQIIAEPYELDPFLVGAIVMTESGGNQYACRYEPNYRWLYKVEECAKRAGTTVETERQLQMCSYGFMQVMGAVFREMEYKGPLLGACEESTNLAYGCAKLRSLLDKYQNSTPDAISAYNAGSARKVIGGYFANQTYVNRVLDWWARLSRDGQILVPPESTDPKPPG